jgi:hypothetical protein
LQHDITGIFCQWKACGVGWKSIFDECWHDRGLGDWRYALGKKEKRNGKLR